MRLQTAPMSELGLPARLATDFLAREWKRHIALREPAFYDWQFLRPPANGGADSCWVMADTDAGELLGLLGCNRRPFYLEGVAMDALEQTTLVASALGTRHGAGARLLMGPQHRHEVLTGMSLSQMGTAAVLRAGYRLLRLVPRFLRVHDLEAIRPLARLEGPAEKLARAWTPREPAPGVTWAPPTSAGMAECFDWLRRHANAFARDEAHLRWRYDEHPYFDYRRLEVHGPRGPAQMAYRIQELPSLRILHLLDCFGPGASDVLPLVDRIAATEGIHLTDFYCTHGGINRHFYANGWFSNNDDTFFRFPHLFNPVEMREPLTNSLCFWSRGHMDALADLGRFYLTKQDMDFDRPAGDVLLAGPRR